MQSPKADRPSSSGRSGTVWPLASAIIFPKDCEYNRTRSGAADIAKNGSGLDRGQLVPVAQKDEPGIAGRDRTRLKSRWRETMEASSTMTASKGSGSSSSRSKEELAGRRPNRRWSVEASMPMRFSRMLFAQASLPADSRMASWSLAAALPVGAARAIRNGRAPACSSRRARILATVVVLPVPGASRDHAEMLQDSNGRRDFLPVRLPVAVREESSESLAEQRNVDPGGRDLRSLQQESGKALLAVPVPVKVEARPVRTSGRQSPGLPTTGLLRSMEIHCFSVGQRSAVSPCRNRARLPGGSARGRCPPRPRRGSQGRQQARGSRPPNRRGAPSGGQKTCRDRKLRLLHGEC